MIGLYHSVRLLPHIVYTDKVIFRLGYQSGITLNINDIEKITTAKQQGGFGEKTPKDTYYAMLSLDSPQYEIYIKEPVLMESTYGRKKYVKTVVFRAEDSKKKIDEIQSLCNG